MTTMRQLNELTQGLSKVLDVPDRRPVSEILAESFWIGEGQLWEPDLVPYMIRPLNETENRNHGVVCFVGPARTGKTLSLILGRYVYIVLHRPRDSMLVHSATTLAQSISDIELKRMHLHGPPLAAEMTGNSRDDNVFHKRYNSGMCFDLAWPSGTQLSSRTYHNMLLTEYDKWPARIGGAGSGFRQAVKRLQNSGSGGMCVVECSPAAQWLDPTWRRAQFRLGSPLSHVFPDTVSGAHANICPIYNDGTREWWYVPCSKCGEYYPLWADISSFGWETDPDPTRAAETAGALCCWCGAIHPESEKREENSRGVWLAEGQIIDWEGKVSGESRLGKTYPSFSLGGAAAFQQTRNEIVLNYLQAKEILDRSGDWEPLKGVVTNDIGAPSQPPISGDLRNPHPLMERQEDLGQWVIPQGVRFLWAAVDIQSYGFVTQVMGYGLNEAGERERWVIDYNVLRLSQRTDPHDDSKKLKSDPARYAEDWRVLDKLLTKSFPLADGSGRRMTILGTLCDSGGSKGVTPKAYDYWRYLKDVNGKNLQNKLRLVKGASRKDAKLIEERWPDTSGKKSRGASRGDVPVLFIHTDRFKDLLAFDLERATPGDGYTHFPTWLKAWWFDDLTREQKIDGVWDEKAKNEPWDLMGYAEAGATWGPIRSMKQGPNGLRRVDWDDPPPWAQPWDKNPYVFHPDDPDEGQKHGGFSADDWTF